ncbi:MAG: hypothetical protein M3O31_01200 [Acidobacteriota bacterium]|nr:hypothetical protein [Acidobacteriota bacterium]
MLDVHAPEHGIHGVRDFMLHLLTITVGLLIALGLEASVEALHHRHQRQEAEQKIREEIRTNESSLIAGAPYVLAERKVLLQALQDLEGFAVDKNRQDLGKLKFVFSEQEIPDAAWRAASSTGVLEYLPYDEVESFSDAYREQALLQVMEQRALEDYLELTPQLDHEPTKEDVPAIISSTRKALGHLNGILAAGSGTLNSYKVVLK